MIFIVIANYNSSQYIDRCLDCCGDFYVVIVDNNSTDSSIEQILDRNDSRICLLRNESNLGFGQANNIGINKALSLGAEYVFLLNQDVYLETDCVEKLIEVHKANPDYGILSPIHLNGKGDDLDYNFSCYLDKIYDSKWKFNFLSGNLKDVYPLPFVNAAGWLIPKSTLEKVGLFDPMFFHYGEDENYCQRLRYYGLKIGVVPGAKLLHDREGSIRISENEKGNLDLIERRLKIELGDLNYEPNFDLKRRIWRNRIIRSFLKLQIKKTFFSIEMFMLLKNLNPEIMDSRKRNNNLNRN